MTNFNIYFPINNLNPQGWITDFITPYIQRSNIRSEEANIFYDKTFTKNSYNLLKQKFGSDPDFKDFIFRRESVEEDKIISLNGNFLDKIEVDSTLKDSRLTPEEYQKYLTFMSTAKPHHLAFFQSYMRLSYGFKEDPNQLDYKFIDFPFTQHYDLDYILNNKTGFNRTEGSGIKNVSVNNEFNYVTHVNNTVTIGFFFGNMDIFSRQIKENGSPADSVDINKKTYPYGFNFMKLITSFDLKKEVIRLEYGRKLGDGFLQYADQEIKDIIEKKERKIINLIKTNHSFDFRQDGVINLNVTYINSGAASFLSSNNIFIPCDISKIEGFETYKNLVKFYKDKKDLVAKTQEDILQQTKKVQESGKSLTSEIIKQNTTKLSDINRELDDIRKKVRDSFPTIFVDKIKQQGRLFGINFNTDKEDVTYKTRAEIFLVKPTDGKFLTLFNIENSYNIKNYIGPDNTAANTNSKNKNDLIQKKFSQIFKTPGNITKNKKQKKFGYLLFFPLRALISAAYSFMCEEEKKIVPHLVLGNVAITIRNKTCSINIGDLLVEKDMFQKWYYEKCLSQDRSEYSYGAFLSDIANDLVPKIIQRNKIINTNSPASIVYVNYYLDSDFTEEQKKALYIDGSEEAIRLYAKKISTNTDITHKLPLVYMTQFNSISSNVQSMEISNNINKFVFNEFEDAKKGIVHVKIGADGGFIKEVSFSADDNSKIRSAYTYESLTNSVSKVLLYYYTLSLSMIGNNCFNDSSYICIPLLALGLESSESDPGLAGYYKVISSTDTIGQDLKYTTNANCVFSFSPVRDKITALNKTNLSENEKIKDYLDISINDPMKYIEELLQRDAETQNNKGIPSTPAPKKKSSIKSKKSTISNTNETTGAKKEENKSILDKLQSTVEKTGETISTGVQKVQEYLIKKSLGME